MKPNLPSVPPGARTPVPVRHGRVTVRRLQQATEIVDKLANYILPFDATAMETPEQRARPTILVGCVLLFLLFGVIGSWAALVPLSAGAVAPGKIVVDTSRKEIQHLEGGIVKQVLVHEGERVKQGQVLVRLDDTAIEDKMEGLRKQIEATSKQIALIDEETQMVSDLLATGDALRSRLLALQRSQAELVGQRSELEQQLNTVSDMARRNEIAAPQDGIITDLQVHTIGGVVKPGETLMTLVPTNDKLIVEGHVTPQDIDAVYPGLEAQVRLKAFQTRFMSPVKGKVTVVSADRFDDQRTGQSYFTVRIEIPQSELVKAGNLKLSAGMPADALIVTGKRTMLSYLVWPIREAAGKAFKEQ